MKVLVISDTHGDLDNAIKAVEQNPECSMLIHLGDYFRDAQKLKEVNPSLEVEYIYGNSDFMIGDVPSEKLLEIEGKRIFITHGHRYSVKWDYDKLEKKALEQNADLLLFGHTHISDIIEYKDFTLVNPGSISDSRGESGESYVVLDVSPEKIGIKKIVV